MQSIRHGLRLWPLGSLRGTRVSRIQRIELSSVLAVARQTLTDQPNLQFHLASVDARGLLASHLLPPLTPLHDAHQLL